MKEIQPLTLELLRKNSRGSFGQPLLQQLECKTMGDGVNCVQHWSGVQGQKPEERFAAPGIDLQPQLQNDPIYTVASGFKRELYPMDVVCGWSMNHFNGRSLAFPPPAQLNLPSAAVFQGRAGQGGRGGRAGEGGGNKLEKKQPMARTGRTS